MDIDIIRQFSDSRDIEDLAGGQNTSVRVGDIAIKPVSDTDKYSWLADELSSVNSDIRFTRPVKSKTGNWLEHGHGATQFLRGTFQERRMREKLSSAAAFHKSVSSIAKPPEFDYWTSPWSLAAKVAWNETPLPQNTHPESARVISSLLGQYEPLPLENRFIHSDLAGNILFDGDRAVIIDISPDFRPVEYAATLLVTDSIAWHHEPLESLDLLAYPPEMKRQLILRAVVFRLGVPIFFDPTNHAGVAATLREFAAVLPEKTLA